MTDSRQISSLFAARIIRAAAHAGLAEAPLYRFLKLRLRGDDFPPIPEERHLALWEEIVRRLGDPGFPILYAETVSIDDYGVLGLACKTAKSVGESLTILERFLPLYADAISLRIERREGAIALLPSRPGAPTLGWRCSIESMLAEIVSAIRSITGARVIPLRVAFAFQAPADLSRHTRFFGVTPTYEAPETALVLPAPVASLALVRADAALCAHLVRELARLEGERGQRRQLPWAERARLEVLRGLPQTPRIDAVARGLAVSTRTLQRHLLAERASFEDVADAARRELAELLLGDAARSVGEVARATGFAEVSSFSRAFRRWTGRAPTAARSPRPGS